MPKSLGFLLWEQTWIITHFNGDSITLRCATVLQIILGGGLTQSSYSESESPESVLQHTLQYYSAMTRNTIKHQALFRHNQKTKRQRVGASTFGHSDTVHGAESSVCPQAHHWNADSVCAHVFHPNSISLSALWSLSLPINPFGSNLYCATAK